MRYPRSGPAVSSSRRVAASPRGRHLVESLGASVALQLCLFATGILVARSLGPAGRGDLAVLILLPDVAAQLVSVGVPAAATYFIVRDRAAWREIVSRLGRVAAVQAALALVLLVAMDAVFLHGHDEITPTARIVTASTIPFVLISNYGLHVLQGLGEIRWFNTFRVAQAAFYALGLTLAQLGTSSVLLFASVWAATYVVAATSVAVVIGRHWRRSREPLDPAGGVPDRRRILRFAAAGFLAQISPIETFRIDVLVTAALFPSQVVGYYAAAGSLSNAPRFAADAVAGVAYPHVAEQGHTGRRSAVRYVLVTAILCGGGAALLVLLMPFLVPFLFGDSFEPAVGVAQVLVVATAVMSVRRVGLDCVRALGRLGAATINELVTLALFALALVVAGTAHGATGIAAALLVATATGLVLVLWRLRPASGA